MKRKYLALGAVLAGAGVGGYLLYRYLKVPPKKEEIPPAPPTVPPVKGELRVAVVNKETGVPVPGATVVVNGITAKTDTNGEAAIKDLSPGTYRLVVSAPSLKTFESSVTIISGVLTVVKVALEPPPPPPPPPPTLRFFARADYPGFFKLQVKADGWNSGTLGVGGDWEEKALTLPVSFSWVEFVNVGGIGYVYIRKYPKVDGREMAQVLFKEYNTKDFPDCWAMVPGGWVRLKRP